jgi:hypothetical protein
MLAQKHLEVRDCVSQTLVQFGCGAPTEQLKMVMSFPSKAWQMKFDTTRPSSGRILGHKC